MTDILNKFVPMAKFDEKAGIVWFRITSETPDSDGQIMDYAASKPHFMAHSESVKKLSGGKSMFNVREQHEKVAAGRAVDMIYKDDGKEILAGVEIVDANTREKYAKGVLNGASIGGKFGKLWPDPANPKLERYEAIPSEFSLVDVPANPDALPVKEFEFVRSDGASEMRKFAKAEEITDEQRFEKALALVSAGDEELEKFLREKLQKAATPPPATSQPAMGAQTEAEPAGDESTGMTADECRAICLQVLEELGLVQKEGATMQMSVTPGDLRKSIDALTLHKSEVATQIDTLQKALTGDIAKTVTAVEELEKRVGAVTGMGPVLMNQGPEAAVDYQIEQLEKLQASAKIPLEAAKLGEQIAKLKIQKAHKG